MKKIFAVINSFFCKPVAVETLGFFRIAVSVFALTQFFVLLPDWMCFYGPDGFLPWEISDALSTTNTPSLLHVTSFLSPLGITANGAVYIVTVIYFLSLTGLLVGYKTRLMGGIAWMMHIVLNTTGHFTAYGVETFAHIALFYCMILPVGCCWSIDSRKKRSDLPPYLITLSVRLIQIHLCIIYLSCGIEKAMGEQWWNGEAIWMAMQQDQFHQVNINWMAQFTWIPKLLCLSTLFIETLYPFGIFWRKTKKLWLTGIISMHLFIALCLGLHLFGALMILLNAAAFGEHCFPGLFSIKWKNRLPGLLLRKKKITVEAFG